MHYKLTLDVVFLFSSTAQLLGMTFKHRRRVNNAMQMFVTSCDKEMHGNIAESKLICVRVDTLLRSKEMPSTLRDVIRLCL